MQTTINLLDMFLKMPSMNPLAAAIKRIEDSGHDVSLTGDIPGLFRIDGGAELTTGQLLDIARKLP